MNYTTSVQPGVDNITGSWIPMPENPLKVYSSDMDSSRIWITSDTHFSHKNILVFEPEFRKFKDIDEMNDAMVKKWNDAVKPDDLVFHLGDFSFGGYYCAKNIASRLNGYRVLLMGNHDRYKKLDWVDDLGFSKVFADPFVLDDKFVCSHEPIKVVPDGMVNIYGHVHGHPNYKTVDTNRFCACVERHGLAPVNYANIKSIFSV